MKRDNVFPNSILCVPTAMGFYVALFFFWAFCCLASLGDEFQRNEMKKEAQRVIDKIFKSKEAN